MKSHKVKVLSMLTDIHGEVDDVKLYVTTNLDHYKWKHSHTFYEFTFVERGSFINNCNGERVTLNKNDILIPRPECAHMIELIPDKTYLFLNLEVKITFLEKLLNQLHVPDINEFFCNQITYIHGSDEDSHEILRLVNMSQNVTVTKEEKQTYLSMIVMKLILKYITAADISGNPTAKSPTIEKVLIALANPDKFSMHIGQICNELGYCQEYVTRLFKKAGLDSPSKIFLKNKMIYASTLLATSNVKIINVAELCGIYTAYYFYKSFKNEFGISPTEYRRKNQIFIH